MTIQLSKLEAAALSLINDKSMVFYAHILMQMNRIEEKYVKTMGVGMHDGRIDLYYNPDFLEKLTPKELVAVLEHEIMHLVMEHPGREKGRSHEIWNVACDMSINQMIEGLPKDCILPEHFKLPKEKWSEFYYEALYKNATKITITPKTCPKGSPQPCPHGGSPQPGQGQGEGKDGEEQEGDGNGKKGKKKDGNGSGQGQGQGQKCQGNCPHKGTGNCPMEGGSTITIETPNGQKVVIDNHEKWGEMMKGDPSLNRESVKQLIKEAYERHEGSKSRGTLPGALVTAIKKWLKPPTVSWKQLLRQYVGHVIRSGSKSTWKKHNRRFGSDIKGRMTTTSIKLVIAVDTSGSVGDKEFKEFICEMKGLLSCYKNDTTIIQSDADVQNVQVFKPYTQLEVKFKRHGYGGTDYEPVFKYVKNKMKDVELVVYLTDFYCTFPKDRPKMPVIWVVTSNGDMNNKPAWGRVVQIKRTDSSGNVDEEEEQ
jgi:predicted metal-dependent peptidase